MSDVPTERQLPFSPPLVPLVMDGTKTETRRIPGVHNAVGALRSVRDLDLTRAEIRADGASLVAPSKDAEIWGDDREYVVYPRWQPGDLGWVRETHQLIPVSDDVTLCAYRASVGKEGIDVVIDGAVQRIEIQRWRPSIHMPKWATRQWVRCRFARFERVQDASPESIIAEGLSTTLREHDAVCHLREQWHELWNATNGHRPGCSYEDNPPVLVIGFEAIPDHEVERARQTVAALQDGAFV